ncbi:MAG TPA: hypothetical protein PLJ21_09640, partial [Pseudobdellovibrionaceae bacterium]|nr:hypothetical protein [Pseudobdellovibrionaceae bacterium]
ISALILKSTLAFGGLKADQLVEQCILKTISNTQAVRIVAVDGGYGEMLEVGEVTSQREIPVYRSLDLSKFDVLKKNFRKLNSDTGAVSLVKNYLFGQLGQSQGIDTFNKIARMTVAVIDLERNRDDQSGASIINAYDTKGKVLYRIGQIGWSIGQCQIEQE